MAMAVYCNKTQLNDENFFCMPYDHLLVALGVISTLLSLSLCWNIFCCVSKCCSGKGICQPKIRRRYAAFMFTVQRKRGPRQMEDNPIYGNISYMQTSMTLFTEADPQHLPLSSSSPMDQQRASCDSQPKSQDCYANLTLKAPRLQSGRSSPQIQYSDVVQSEELPVSEKEDDAVCTMSDLYASVQTQRTKTIDAAYNGEGYANHL